MPDAAGGSLTAAPNYLLVRSGPQSCGLPLAQVIEIFRPLPIQAIGDAPAFVLGLSMVRGAPVPVVDLRLLLGIQPDQEAARLVHLRLAGRRLALAVDRVLGLREVPESASDALPPLVAPGSPVVEALSSLDGELLLLLRSARLFPAEWLQIA
jgi:purine-binding chemotaxis protein CheW